MDNVMIKNAQGEQLNINVVRYFRLNGIEYLVFSLNEVDEGGYVKLYISKVNGDFANTITDDVEWNLIKDTVKTIIKSNKENLPLPITDLDVRKLGNIQVVDQKVFKLSETFIQLLGANKNIEAYEEPTQPAVAPVLPVMESASVVEGIDLDSIQQNPITESNSTYLNQEVIQENSVGPVLPQFEETSVDPVTQPAINDFVAPISVETPTVETSSVGMTLPISENNLSDLENTADYGLDYKTLYENELDKNKLLTEEIEKYKSIINNLKNIINGTETF